VEENGAYYVRGISSGEEALKIARAIVESLFTDNGKSGTDLD
jgi:hypothetical protein